MLIQRFLRLFFLGPLILFVGCLCDSCAAQPETDPSRQTTHSASAVCFGANGEQFIAYKGQSGQAGDGSLVEVHSGQRKTLAADLDDPVSMAYFNDALLVVDRNRILRVSRQGTTEVLVDSQGFPRPPRQLRDIAVLASMGLVLVTDAGDEQGLGGGVFLIRLRNKSVKVVADADSVPGLGSPHGVVFDGESFCIYADKSRGELVRVNLTNGQAHSIAKDLNAAEDVVWDHFGQLFVTAPENGKVWALPRPGQAAVVVRQSAQGFGSGAVSLDGQQLVWPQADHDELVTMANQIPGWEVDYSPLAVRAEVAFPNLKWTGWDDGSESGVVNPLRPLVLTTAPGDGQHVYVATQHGVIHRFENSDQATETKVLLDFNERVRYRERENEEGFLGLAFHPRFRENGEFFVFYTDIKAKMANVVSRFRVRADNPAVADLDSEEELLRFVKPYWNHDGGCLVFGPDGYLYVSHGDGGAGGDPHGNGQNLKTWLGKVLRIDVDRKDAGKNYAIPTDNPFVDRPDALPEIYAYGLRNIWRMAFDRETNVLWGGEVGQNLYEEIVLIRAGGNYGWNPREAFHPFGAQGVDVNAEMIEPIWEYHHDLGKSITGGAVYRGSAIPELRGAYVYADYVSGRVWALRYNEQQQRVVENRTIEFPSNLQILSFGEDQQGELYALVASPTGKGIYRFVSAK